MGAWMAYLGKGDATLLKCLLGKGAEIRTGAGFGLGVINAGSELVTLAVALDGSVKASLGCATEAGCEAIFTPSSPTLTLTCDPFGLHSIYTVQIENTFWCASDLRLLRRLPGVSHEIDPAALHGYLCFSYVPTPLTMFRGVSALPAGSRLVVTQEQQGVGCRVWGVGESPIGEPGNREQRIDPTIQRFNYPSTLHPTPYTLHPNNQPLWREREPTTANQETSVIQLRERLRTAVARRLGNEREAGVFLSGGLDSSLIAALLAEAGARVHLFTLDFGPPFDLELPCARQVAAHLGRPLNVVPACPVQILSALDATAAALHQPFGDGVTVPLTLLGKAASQVVGTIFNGEGGDQLFGGWANKPMVAAELYGAANYDREAAYLATFHRFYGLTDTLYTPGMMAATQSIDVGAWIRPALNAERFSSLLHRLRAANLLLKGAQNIAPRATQLAAAHGLQMRAPFFDRALTDWTFALPPEWFLQGACEKYLLKRAAEPYLPSEIVWQEKRGMGVPTTDWCVGPLRREIARRLSPRRLQRDNLFQPQAIATLRRGEDSPGEFRRRRVGEKLWTLLMLHICRV